MVRESTLKRNTKETSVNIYVNLDGEGLCDIDTEIGFFNHMLELLTFHSEMDLTIDCVGDIEVCDHHTVEDVGIVFGQAFNKALGNKVGIERYGSSYIPMDEALARICLDISNRPFLVFKGDFKREKIGKFSTEMVEEFFRAFSFNAGITLHIEVLYGENDHHKIEAIFKGVGRALKVAKSITTSKLQSTKGII
ncbi:imidazoleglycerol-phosphate dehydratase HisB [uncultured Clostridium sp.]|uniref:imidazoleglycerol-phosphate dehydratase HisB n=1 Tax=uncultured Clostridium sp. TaxID=59620 RepID=UPI002615A4B8|nr:imidazoleglycerol-phosphate dehydratase HisB [uncultured Clostridium sp.]